MFDGSGTGYLLAPIENFGIAPLPNLRPFLPRPDERLNLRKYLVFQQPSRPSSVITFLFGINELVVEKNHLNQVQARSEGPQNRLHFESPFLRLSSRYPERTNVRIEPSSLVDV